MNSYSRLLIHRLADIFGFAHQSVGEGDDRHLILECCPETAIPSILVSDLLSQSDEHQSPMMPPILAGREENPQGSTSPFSFEKEKRAYFVACDRHFWVDSEARESIKQKPRSDPAVARRMIAHALGRRIKRFNPTEFLKVSKESSEGNDAVVMEEDAHPNLSPNTCQNANILPGQCVHSYSEQRVENNGGAPPVTGKVVVQNAAGSDKISSEFGSSRAERKVNLYNDNLKENHIGAAKRIFAHALGFYPRRTEHSNHGGPQQTSGVKL